MRARTRVGRTTRARGAAIALLLAAGIGTGLLAQAGTPSRADLDTLAQKVERVESLRRIKDGDLGPLPVIIGLIAGSFQMLMNVRPPKPRDDLAGALPKAA